MFFRSPTGRPAAAEKPASLWTGAASPVRADSSAIRSSVHKSLRSAGTCLPVSSTTRSPGTSSAASISWSVWSRRTTAFRRVIFFRASRAFFAFPSWIMPTAPFKAATAAMIQASPISPRNTEMTPAAAST